MMKKHIAVLSWIVLKFRVCTIFYVYKRVQNISAGSLMLCMWLSDVSYHV